MIAGLKIKPKKRDAFKLGYSKGKRWAPEFPDMRDPLYEFRCASWIEQHVTVRPPPTLWGFVPKIQCYHEQLRAGGIVEKPQLTSDEAVHRNVFDAWYGLVRGDLWDLRETLAQAELDRDLDRRKLLVATASLVHQEYAELLERGRIKWLPLDCEYRDREGGRTRIHCVEALRIAVRSCEDAAHWCEAIGEKLPSGEWRWYR